MQSCESGIMVEIADELCQGRLVMIHEGGYSEAYIPFCGMAIMEELSGKSGAVVDPMIESLKSWQPDEEHQAYIQKHLEKVRQIHAC
jgi:acetoin utilization deacetylase AcuC-like enzyme